MSGNNGSRGALADPPAKIAGVPRWERRPVSAVATAAVTGATGFIGLHLVEALAARGWRVKALARATSSCDEVERAGADVCRAPLDDANEVRRAIAGADVVFHLAGEISGRDEHKLRRTNAELTMTLAAACAEQPRPPILVACSSLAAAGPSPAMWPRDRHFPAAPVSHYGRSKRAGERALEELAAETPTTIVRPGIVFGPRGRELLPMWKAIQATRLHFIPGLFAPPLSMVHVHDLVDLLIAAAERGERLLPRSHALCDVERGYYFAADEHSPTFAQLGLIVGRQLGTTPFIVHLVEPAIYAVAATLEALSGLIRVPEQVTIDKIRDALVASWQVDASRERRQLGWAPARPLVERLAETTAWYRHAGWL